MKKLCTVLLLALIINQSFSQEMKTLFKKDTVQANSYGGYGAPMVGAAMLNNSWGVLVGGKGGLIRNHHFAFGGIGAAIITSTSIKDTVLNFSHNLAMGYGGIFLEYIFNFDSPIHISLPLNVAAGGILAGGKNDTFKIKSSGLFIVEPGINLEFNFSKHFVPALNIGYRIVTANTTEASKAASGLNIALILKIGKF